VDNDKKPVLYGPNGKPLILTSAAGEHRPAKKLEEQLRKARVALWRMAKTALARIIGIATLYSCVVLLPADISVEPYKILDPSNPFTEQFVITNNSVYSLRNFEAACGIWNFRAKVSASQPPIEFGIGAGWVGLLDRPPIVPLLSRHDQETINCPAWVYDVKSVTLLIDIRFNPPWFGKKNDRHIFIGKPASSGTVEWLHMPENQLNQVPPLLTMPPPPHMDENRLPPELRGHRIF
jgi:hypothetical protein